MLFAFSAMKGKDCIFMQLKCPLGQAENPILLQGLQARFST